MSKYTTELRYLIETGFPLPLSTYPIFDESYRPQLNQKIIDHYSFREIGFETAGLFANRLSERLNLIMPYYNQLYKSALLEFDPLLTTKLSDNTDAKRGENVDQTKNQDTTEDTTLDTTLNTTQDTTQDTTGTTDTTAKRTEDTKDNTTGKKTSLEDGTNTEEASDGKDRKEVGSDTPQGLLNMSTITGDVYASTAAIAEETDTHTGNQHHTINTTEDTTTDFTRTIAASETSHGDTTGKLTGNVTGLNTGKNIGKNTANLSETANQERNGWETVMKTIQGYQGQTASEMLLKFRETFLNIDMMVINDLETLFMCIY